MTGEAATTRRSSSAINVAGARPTSGALVNHRASALRGLARSSASSRRRGRGLHEKPSWARAGDRALSAEQGGDVGRATLARDEAASEDVGRDSRRPADAWRSHVLVDCRVQATDAFHTHGTNIYLANLFVHNGDDGRAPPSGYARTRGTCSSQRVQRSCSEAATPPSATSQHRTNQGGASRSPSRMSRCTASDQHHVGRADCRRAESRGRVRQRLRGECGSGSRMAA